MTLIQRIARKRWSLLLLACVAAGVGILYLSRGFLGPSPLRILALLPVSGPAHNAGTAVYNGLMLASEEINAWGGVNGRRIELVLQDSKVLFDDDPGAFRPMDDRHPPDLWVTATSRVAMQAAPLSEKIGVPLVGLVAATPELTRERRWVFKYFTAPETEVEAMLSVLRDLKVENLGFMYLDDDYGRAIFGLMEAHFLENGRIRGYAFAMGRRDFTDSVEKLQDTQAVAIIGYQVHILGIVGKLRHIGYRGQILSGNAFDSTSAARLSELEGVYLTAPAIYNENFAFARRVGQKYAHRFGIPLNHFAANGYDFLKLFADLLDEVDISRKTIRSALERDFIYEGVFGHVESGKGRHDILFPLLPARIENRKIRYLR